MDAQERGEQVTGRRHQIWQLAVMLVLSGFLGACAGTGEVRDERDPLEGYNRGMYAINDTLDNILIKQVARGYQAVLPGFVNTGISNFFSNLNDISVTVNDLLQFKPKQAALDGGRFALNTTVGILGFIDIGTRVGLPKHNEDFGQTLGAWGVGSGPYFVLPILGPSTIRDAFALIPEWYLDPVTYVSPTRDRTALIVLRGIDQRAGLLNASRVLEEAALDPYEFVRDGYLQRREYLIHDGNPPSDFDDFDEFDWDEPEEPALAPAAS